MTRWAIALVVCGAIVSSAGAAFAEVSPDKKNARTLFRSAVATFQQGDYTTALDLYDQAYAKYPSSKILLNRGTCLLQLDRRVEAANTYERYLQAEDASPRHRRRVTRLLASLDNKLGVLLVRASPSDASIAIDGDSVGHQDGQSFRVEPGSHELVVKRDGFATATRTVFLTGGQNLAVEFTLTQSPRPPAPPPPSAATVTRAAPAQTPSDSRIGAVVRTDIDGRVEDGRPRGAVVVAGVMWRATSFLDIVGGGLLGRNGGFYTGATLAVPGWPIRPSVSVGLPVYFMDGPRPAAHGALGVRVELGSHLSLSLDLGVQRFLNAPAGFEQTLLVPSLGASVFL